MSFLTGLFTTVLNMSVTASYVVVGVFLVRLGLRKSPKVLSYALWAVVLFRLVCPFSFPLPFSALGLFNAGTSNGTVLTDYVPRDIAYMPTPAINTGLNIVDNAVNNVLPQAVPAASLNPMQVWMTILSVVWIIGIIALLAYSVVSYIKLKRRLQTATLVTDNIYESDQIGTAFVCGFIRPHIYVPSGVKDADLPYILEHERTHIRRRDHLIKPLASLALLFHWFNPLVWLSFRLLTRDMEMSCDESVLARMGDQAKIRYSGSLLSLSIKSSGLLTANALAFGESHVKARIKNVLSYKRPGFWLGIIATVAVATALVAFAGNPQARFDLEKTSAEAMMFSSAETDLVKIGEAAFKHYYSSFMGENVPKEYRITGYKLNDITPIAGDEKELCVAINYDHTTTGTYFLSANGAGEPKADGGFEWRDSYGEIRIKSLGGNTYQIVGMGTGGGAQGLTPITQGNDRHDAGIVKIVEDNLAIIISPAPYSNPWLYIQLHENEYENIIKYGGEKALVYMLSEFKNGNTEGLRGFVMMELCKDLLGVRNNVVDEFLTPEEWYTALVIRQEIKLPDFVYKGTDSVEKLVYATEIEQYKTQRGFTVVSPRIHGSYEEGDRLKVFVTTHSATYRLYGNVLDSVGGSSVPAAITYKKNPQGEYELSDYQQARDGSEFAPSIRKFCTMPVSGNVIEGLADRMLGHYGDYEDLRILQRENLYQHLKGNGITDATLFNRSGEIEFSMSNPQ